MKAVILAGGLGSRLSEETHLKPKPMVEVGGKPILWHIMKIYSAHGINDFIICCGYKGQIIKDYFSNYFLYNSDVTFDIPNNKMEVHHEFADPWRVTVVDTGEGTMTGGRLKRVAPFLGEDQNFCMTYGDGVSDVDISGLINFHNSNGKLATLTAVQTPGRYGVLDLDGNEVIQFREKPMTADNWINGGFFVLSTKVLSYIDGDDTIWEREPMTRLAGENQFSVFKHHGYWQCMDTLRDRDLLESEWRNNVAPWKVWG